ncbi:MAG: nucleoside monophosphate kinase [Patescibacteria group bacterium]
METKTIFFIGKPGCGKGMQAKMLSKVTVWRVVSSGQQFRAMAEEDTPVGHKVKAENDAGMLQPYWLATYLFLKTLFLVRADEGVIFDGSGRKVQEAELIIDSLKWLGRPCIVLNIQISDKSVRRRLALRKNIESRTDDFAIEERLNEYHKHTEPVIELFRRENVLIEIDGEPTPEKIAVDIKKKLNLPDGKAGIK